MTIFPTNKEKNIIMCNVSFNITLIHHCNYGYIITVMDYIDVDPRRGERLLAYPSIVKHPPLNGPLIMLVFGLILTAAGAVLDYLFTNFPNFIRLINF